MTRRTRIAGGVLALAVAASTAGCAKRTIDPEQTGSVSVPGTDGSLQKFCDGSILIYWTPNVSAGESDDYEFIVYDGCTPDGQIVNGSGGTGPRTEDLQTGEDDD